MEQEFLESLIPKRSEFLTELREKSEREESYAPIIEPQAEQLLITMLAASKPRRVLEIGTAVGYSAVLMAENLPENSEIITVERYKKHAEIAVDNVFAVGREKQIRVIEGEAAEVLAWLDGEFDFIFLDAAKGQYLQFLPDILRLLKSGGILFSDDILYKGMVEDDDAVVRRKITIVKRLRAYLEAIMNHPMLTTAVTPIGDGVAISVKK